jgi:hypothetical protein
MTPAAKEGLPAVVGELVAEMRDVRHTDCENYIYSQIQRWADRLSALTAEAGKGEVVEGYSLIDNYELARLRERDNVETMALIRGDVWYWQGDGHDMPESLTCPVIMSAETLRQLLALSTATPAGEWREIESAPKDVECWFWVVPKTAEETYRNTLGEPILSSATPHALVRRYGAWSSLCKATHWQPYVVPAPPLAASPRGASESGNE